MNYLLYYLIFGFLGWIVEFIYMLFTKSTCLSNNIINYKKIMKCHPTFPICGDTLVRYIKLCIPFLNVYGLGAVILAILSNRFKHWNLFVFSIFGGYLVTVMECIIGQMSFNFNHYQTWNYRSNICKGYISFNIFIYWIILVYLFRWIYYYIENK
jgi:uncharacterized membrane protein